MQSNIDKNKIKIRVVIEIILLVVVVALLVILGILSWLNYEYGQRPHEYNQNSYTLTSTDNAIIATVYYKDGTTLKNVETTYFTNGQPSKIIDEYHYTNIYMAKYDYEKQNIGSLYNDYEIERKDNVLIYTYNNPKVSYDISSALTDEEIEYLDKIASFDDNKEAIEYILQYMDKNYSRSYVRIN